MGATEPAVPDAGTLHPHADPDVADACAQLYDTLDVIPFASLQPQTHDDRDQSAMISYGVIESSAAAAGMPEVVQLPLVAGADGVMHHVAGPCPAARAATTGLVGYRLFKQPGIRACDTCLPDGTGPTLEPMRAWSETIVKVGLPARGLLHRAANVRSIYDVAELVAASVGWLEGRRPDTLPANAAAVRDAFEQAADRVLHWAHRNRHELARQLLDEPADGGHALVAARTRLTDVDTAVMVAYQSRRFHSVQLAVLPRHVAKKMSAHSPDVAVFEYYQGRGGLPYNPSDVVDLLVGLADFNAPTNVIDTYRLYSEHVDVAYAALRR